MLTRRGYERAGGHAAVRGEVLEDIALLRAVKRAGGRGALIDGSRLAACRMYDGWPALRDGYAKSLWAAVGRLPGGRRRRGGRADRGVRASRRSRRCAGSRAGLLGYAAGVPVGPRSPPGPAAGCGRTRWPTRCPCWSSTC